MQNKKSVGTTVLVDYKNTSSGSTGEVKASPRVSRYTDPDDVTTATGNGRIRKTIALCGITVVGALFIDNVFSGDGVFSARHAGNKSVQNQSAQLPLLGVATGAPAAEPAADVEAQAEKPEFTGPEFLFNPNTPTLVSTQENLSEVPFVEVEEIDELIDPSDEPVAAFINPAPLTAAKPELANDYSQEPSQILVKIEKGDSLFAVLEKHGLSHAEIASLAAQPHIDEHLTTLQPGDEIELDFDGSHRLTGLTREIDLEKTLTVTRVVDNQFKSKLDVSPLEKTIQVADFKLDSSLFVDGSASGLSESLIMELYSIFQWTVDFNREVRAGDAVTVLYETYSKNGKWVKNGNILAAEYHASDATHNAFRHVRNGQRTYFDADGQSLKKRFLRNPIKARVTSRYNLARKHPIRHTIQAHRGVDYGAPTGTPISSAGDGRVVFMGVRGGYGKTVEIQHGDRYTTLYAHLSKFPKRMKQGSRVTQGQVIGFVGRTGLATGPHLHYEFRVDGIHQDPQKVELPGSSPLEKGELMTFKANIEPLRSQLASLRQDSETLAMR